MIDTSIQFVGSIPEFYDSGLGPNIFQDFGNDLARRAGAVKASNVLELAAGTGIVSRMLRDALAPTARLVITDLNQPMLDIAGNKFSPGENVEFSVADAMALPFDDSQFDLMVCQFGVMFFPDKPASFREAARVLKPSGHYVFNTWGPMSANPYSLMIQELVTQFYPENPPIFYTVPFSYSDPSDVMADLKEAGWEDVEHDTMQITKIVADPGAFAHATVYGNPLIDEIRQRGGVDPDDVANAVHKEFLARFGPLPASMPLQATAFVCRAP